MYDYPNELRRLLASLDPNESLGPNELANLLGGPGTTRMESGDQASREGERQQRMADFVMSQGDQPGRAMMRPPQLDEPSAAPAFSMDSGDQPSRQAQSQSNALRALLDQARSFGDQPSRAMDRASSPASQPPARNLASLPTNELRDAYHPAQGGFVRNESTGQTLFLNGQPGGISDSPESFQGGARASAGPQRPSQVQIKMAGYGNDGIMSDLGSTTGPVPQIDMTRNPVDTPRGKGYYGKDGAVYVQGPDGFTKIVMGYDRNASMALNKADLERRAGEANILHTNAATAEIGSPEYQLTPEGDVFNKKTGMISSTGAQAGQLDRQKQKSAYDAGLKELQKDDASIAGTSQLEQALARWEELQPQVSTGRIMGHMPAVMNPQRQELEQLQNYLSMNNFKAGQGSMSNMERALIKASGPNVLNDPETNMDSIKVMRGGIQTMRDRDSFRQAYLSAKGNLLGSDQAWQTYLDANPRYVSDAGSGKLAENPSRADWQSYFGGAQQQRSATPKTSGELASPPDPRQYIGKRMQAPDGTIYKSDGTRWMRQ